MKDILKSVLLTLVAAIILFVLYVKDKDSERYDNNLCKSYYGSQYSFLEGGQSPDLCITKEGDVRYFYLIGE